MTGTHVDPIEIYKHGRGFFNAIDQLHGSVNVTAGLAPQLASPILVLSAFSSEVFLKCLICIETGNSPRGHELDKLFSKLTPATQSIIEAKWNAIMVAREPELRKLDASLATPVPRDLHSVLVEGSKTFELVRYIYEPGGPDFRAFISDLPIPLIEAIWQLRPSWKAI